MERTKHIQLAGAFAAVSLAIAMFSWTASAAAYEGFNWQLGGNQVTENVAVRSHDAGGLILEDSKMGAGIQCKESSEGKVAPEGKGEITNTSLTECKSLALCETSNDIVAKAVHLPWTMQLEGVAGLPRVKFANGGAGTPGWSIECLVLGLKIKEECTGETTAGTGSASGGINIIFDPKSTYANCTLGGSSTGIVRGAELYESTSSSTLGAEGLGPTPWAVSVGDSYISGEGGRWAGNSNSSPANVDALGPLAYNDDPTLSFELIPGCHRSASAEILIFPEGANAFNFACSGAKTSSYAEGSQFKPGLDFEAKALGAAIAGGGTCPLSACEGQAAMLMKFAKTHLVKMVAISIGGNNFNFATIVRLCNEKYVFSTAFCSTEPAATNEISGVNVANRRLEIKLAIERISTAMSGAGYLPADYTILVQNYPSTIPTTGGFRYNGTDRYFVGGCAFYNQDADWANSQLLPAINGAVLGAASDTKLTNIVFMNIVNALVAHRLCENGLYHIEPKSTLELWSQEHALVIGEWVTEIRGKPSAPYAEKESLHPNFWGQLALRNCLRQAYNLGKPKSGECALENNLETSLGEPNMILR
jgi:hypothetical protein